MKKNRIIIIIIAVFTIATLAAFIGTAYAAISKEDLPINVPGRQANIVDPSISNQTQGTMKSWGSLVTYTPPETPDDFQEVIDSGELELDEVTDNEFYKTFSILDKKTVEDYLAKNPDLLKNGYQALFIDKVDMMNTPTGIKTTIGDDVLAIDAVNKIIVIGRDVVNGSSTSKVKLALVYDQTELDMSLVRDLSYWDIIEKHAKNTGAILAINASSYNWSNSGSYAILYGAVKWHDQVFRKANNTNNLIMLDKDGTLSIGSNMDGAYNAVEMMPILIKNGTVMYVDHSKDVRSAQTAIGQTEDGVTLMLVGSGGVYGSKLGVTESEILKIMQDYKAYNASILSGGSRSIMYWNGRIVTESVGYDDAGVRLPNAFIVVPFSNGMANDTFVDDKETSDTTSDDSSSLGEKVTGETGNTEGNKAPAPEK